MKLFVLNIIFVLSTLQLLAQEVEVKCNANKKAITIGEHFKYTIQVKSNQANTSIVLPILPDTFNGFEIIEKSKVIESTENSISIQTQTYTLTHFDSGRWVLPAFNVKYNLPNQNTQEVFSDTISINVNTPQVDFKKPIRDIVGPDKEGFTWKTLLFIWLGIIAILLVVFLISKIFIRKRKIKEAVWYRAIKTLENEVKNKTWLQNPKQFSSVVSDTLREYLHEHLRVYTLDKPTKELLENVKNSSVTVDHFGILNEIFVNTDFVKFAKATLPDSQLEAIANNALAFVQKTHPTMLENDKRENP